MDDRYNMPNASLDSAMVSYSSYAALKAERDALADQVEALKVDAQLGAYVKRVYSMLGRQTEAFYDNVGHAIDAARAREKTNSATDELRCLNCKGTFSRAAFDEYKECPHCGYEDGTEVVDE